MMRSWQFMVWALAGWFVVWTLLDYMITRVMWNKRWAGPAWMPPLLRAWSGVWSAVLPIAAISTFWSNGSRIPGGSIGAFYALLLVYVLVASYCANLWRKYRVRLAGGKISSIPMSQRWGKSSRFMTPAALMLGYFAIVLTPGISTYAGFYMIAGMCYFMWDAARKKKLAPVGMVEMEEVPLLSEIQRVCGGYGRTIKQVFVRMQPVATSYAPIPLMTFDNPYSDRKPRLVVQSENLQELNPATYTAALAYHFAKMPTARLSDKTAINPVGFWVILLAMVVIIGGFVVFSSIFVPSTRAYLASKLVLIPFLVFMAAIAVRVYFASSGFRAHRAAFKIWKAAEPAEQRSVQDYANAIAEHHAFHNRIEDPELVHHQLRLDQGFRRFVAEQLGEDNSELEGDDKVDVVLARATEHVREWKSERDSNGVNEVEDRVQPIGGTTSS